MKLSQQELRDLDDVLFRYNALCRDVLNTFCIPLKYKSKEHKLQQRLFKLQRRVREESQK